MVEVKPCTKCGVAKSLLDFPPDPSRPTGRQSWCRACKSENRRQAYLKDPAKILASNRRWAKANPDQVRQIRARWVERHPGYVSNLNREKAAARSRRWEHRNRGYVAERARRRRALRRVSQATRISVEDVAARMAFWGNRCWMCGGPFEHVDHVKPVSQGGPHLLANLRPACGRCNRRKGGRWPFPVSRSSFPGWRAAPIENATSPGSSIDTEQKVATLF